MSTDLTALVCEAVKTIPPGTVISYRDLAERVGRPRAVLAVANALGAREDAESWQTTPAEEIDVPWWRVMRGDGTMLRPDHEMDAHREAWTAWARRTLLSEGVAFTNDGRVASLATQRAGGGRGARSTRKPSREPSPCGRHEKIEHTCRDCSPR